MIVEVFADGSATIAAKPGGYGWVMCIDGKKHSEGNGFMDRATNNDAEMAAAIHGLAAALKLLSQPNVMNLSKDPSFLEVILCSDSQITLGWADGTYKFKQPAKMAKYEALRELVRRLQAKTRWVKGHSGHEHNERCDELANLGRHKLTPNDKIPGKQRPRTKLKKIGHRTEGIIVLKYGNSLKLVDLCNNLIEDYELSVHGERKEFAEIDLGVS